MNVLEASQIATKIKDNIQKVIIGKDEVIKKIITAFLAGGHVLLEDTPGTGKTLLSKTLAKSIDAEFKRIQFTPDLLPSDITGLNIYNQKENCFTFLPGPAFTNVLLADEINRATPRTQSSLLECMEERQITVDGTTRALSDLFFVAATQNPIETAGTFPLPEAQMDRFMMQLCLGFPTQDEELKMIDRFIANNPLEQLSSVCSIEDIRSIRELSKTIYLDTSLREYIVAIANATRKHTSIALGVSPRGTLALIKAAQVFAAISNRTYVLPDDIKALVQPVFGHRLLLHSGTLMSGLASNPLTEILNNIPVPSEYMEKNQ